MRVKMLAVATILMIAAVAEAGLSKSAQEWRRGPEKFLMTNEEEKSWKSVTTDEAAANFIDLFWARRDSTPGTPRNEFREEFLTRVRFSDSSFPEKKRRGALTDRGQVYIVLGPPEKGSREAMGIAAPSGMSQASSRSADSIVWNWTREEAKALGMLKIHATFNQIVGTDTYVRDTKRGEFSNVSALVIQRNVVNPSLTEVPDWAARVSKEVFSPGAATVAKADVKAEGRIGRVVLLRDLGVLNLDASSDPLASLQPVTEFTSDESLAFVLEYCASPGPLKLEARIGSLAAASEMDPAPMRAVTGCGVVPGMLSLEGLKKGTHELQITTIEPNGARLTTKQAFAVK